MCAALSALDTYIGLAGVADVLNAARTDVQQATLVLEVGRRLPGLAPASVEDDQLAALYDGLGADDA